MKAFLMITFDYDGSQLGAFVYKDKKDAESALLTDVGEKHGSPLVEDECNNVLSDAYSNSGIQMYGSWPSSESNIWYLREVTI